MYKVVFVFKDGERTVVCFPELGIHKSLIEKDEEYEDIKTSSCDHKAENHQNGCLVFSNSDRIRNILAELS